MVEIHSIHTQEIVQLISLPVPSIPNAFSLQPRSLVRSWTGLELGSATGANKVDQVFVPLLPSPSSSRSSPYSEPPKTPTKSAPSVHSLDAPVGKGTAARTLVVGKNSLYALAPLTLVVQADALIEKGRYEDALALARQMESLGGAPDASRLLRTFEVTWSMLTAHVQNPEVAYVYLRAAYHHLSQTLFQEAFELFLQAGADPRLVVRMFPDLRDPLLRSDEEISVCRGIRADVMAAQSIDDFGTP